MKDPLERATLIPRCAAKALGFKPSLENWVSRRKRSLGASWEILMCEWFSGQAGVTMSLINENLHCARARAQRSGGTKEPLSRASPLCQGGCTSILWRSPNLLLRGEKALLCCITQVYQRKKGAFFVFCLTGNLQGEFQKAEYTMLVLSCIISMFRYASQSKPTLMACKSLTAELQSECVSADKQARGSTPLCLSLGRKMGFIFVYMSACMVGNYGSSQSIYTHLLGEFFF